MNDDGVNTIYKNQVNVYKITALYTRDKKVPTDEQINIEFQMIHTATDFYDVRTKCSKVNANDLLQTIYIY